jgi:hypothetical protein
MQISVSYSVWSKCFAGEVKGIPSKEMSLHSFFPVSVMLQTLQLSVFTCCLPGPYAR